MTANIHLGSGRSLWPGVADAAEQHDVNLICFPGGRLRASEGFEAQRNLIYELIDTERLDGLVSWSSTVGGSLDPAELVRFHQKYRALPIISLAHLAEGTPVLSVDSYQGMRALIIHLIEGHGYQRLAFIRGPLNHYYAEERYRAYVDVLDEYGLPFVADLVSPPVHWEAGAEAIGMLLDRAELRPGVDFQAVVAVSDLLALDVLKTLQSRGIHVPRDVAVVGFNNSKEGRLATPPLTSVALPFYAQGERAIETLLTQLADEQVPAQVILPSRLIVRQSCGCPSHAVQQAAAGSLPGRSSQNMAPTAATPDLGQEPPRLLPADSVPYAEWAEQVRLAFDAELAGNEPPAFLSTLEHSLSRVIEAGGDIADWQGIISTLRRRALGSAPAQLRPLAEDLLHQARVMIGETAQRVEAYQQLQADRQSQLLHEIGQTLITTFDIDKLMDVIAESLPRIGIRSCYLALYEDCGGSLAQSRLVLAYRDHQRVPLEAAGLGFASRQLVPDGLLPGNRRYSLILEPLYFREEQIGFVLFEVGPRDGTMYEVLRGYISSALKGALLFREAQQARLAAEKADQIKTRLLANVSHELRTPLHIILDHTRDLLAKSPASSGTGDPSLMSDVQHIQQSAAHQLQLINDLLDLSRAEIDELDLFPELLDPRALLEEVFQSLASGQARSQEVTWHLQLPARLPWIQADPMRLRQILLNLLSNASKFTQQGQITLGAEIEPPSLHIWVADTGIGIRPKHQEQIFEPFVTAGHNARPQPGSIGLGLSITRRLVALHGGSMTLNSRPGQGSTFHVYLPLPSLIDQPARAPAQARPVLLFISSSDTLPDEIRELSQRQGLEIQRLDSDAEVANAVADLQPAALAWDLSNANPGDWMLVRRLREHRSLSQRPFIVYGQQADAGDGATFGVTTFTVEPTNRASLLDTITAVCPLKGSGPIVIVDDDSRARERYRSMLTQEMPGYAIKTADNGVTALEVIAQEMPSLVILDLTMPEMDGFDVLDRMRANPQTCQVPVLILSGRILTFEDIQRLEQHALVTLQSKGILSDAELIGTLHRALFGTDTLPAHTSSLVKRAVAYLHQNYDRPLSRWEVAQAIGVSEDYLSKVFYRELGLSPWEYLNRYRISQAKQLLRHTNSNIKAVAKKVGFRDQGYFSRVFHKLVGVSPKAYRKQPDSP